MVFVPNNSRLDALKFAQELEEFNARMKGFTEIDLEEMLKKAKQIAEFLDATDINSNGAQTASDTKDTIKRYNTRI